MRPVRRKKPTEMNLKLIQHHHEIVMEQWRQNCGITKSIFRDQKDYAAMVLRASLTINGGGAVALLVYMGHTVGRHGNGGVPQDVICALYIFIAGIVLPIIGVLRLTILQNLYNKTYMEALSKAEETIKKGAGPDNYWRCPATH